jgi:hypothetical protein
LAIFLAADLAGDADADADADADGAEAGGNKRLTGQMTQREGGLAAPRYIFPRYCARQCPRYRYAVQTDRREFENQPSAAAFAASAAFLILCPQMSLQL